MLVLSRRDVLELLTARRLHRRRGAGAFRLHAEGRTLGPGVLGVHAAGGGFHIKAAGLARRAELLRRQDQRELP